MVKTKQQIVPTPKKSEKAEWAFMGIDPGRAGGMAIIQGGVLTTHSLADKLTREVWNCINHYATEAEKEGVTLRCVIEKQLPRPTKWYDKHTNVWRTTVLASTVILFGYYKELVGLLTASGIDFEEMLPQQWHRALQIEPKRQGETDVQWKNRLRDEAVTLFPSGASNGTGIRAGKITLAHADAVLIAHYCRRRNGGE